MCSFFFPKGWGGGEGASIDWSFFPLLLLPVVLWRPNGFGIFQANIRRKLSKEERLALIRAGREDRGKYQARTALKQKKVRFYF